VTDGTNAVAGTATLDITPFNDAPTLSAIEGAALQYVVSGPAAPITGALTVIDVDSANLTGATVAISTNYVSGEDVLVFTGQNGISGSWDAVNGVLTLTGSATVADYQAALRSVSYVNASSAPTAGTRTVSIAVSDGSAGSATVARNVTVTAVTVAPVVPPPVDNGPPPDPVKDPAPPADTPPGPVDTTGGGGGETGTPAEPPGGGGIPSGMIEPAVFTVSDAGTPVASESNRTADRRRDGANTPPKFLHDAVENIRSLLDFDSAGLPRIDNAALWKALDAMNRQMSEFGGADGRTGAIVGQFAGGAGLFLSIGFVNWVFRGGSLAAAMLSTMPMWRGLDPLPVLLSRSRRDDDKDGDQDTPAQREVPDDVDRLFSTDA